MLQGQSQQHIQTMLAARAGSGGNDPALKDLLMRSVTGLTGRVKSGALAVGQDFVFAAISPASVSAVTVMLHDDGTQRPMIRLSTPVSPTEALWYRVEKLRSGVTQGFQFFADGKPLQVPNDTAGYTPDSYQKAGVPEGKLSEKLVVTSKLYDGMKADYWIYASAGVDPAKPAPLMVWQDGLDLISRDSSVRLQNVTDNLVAQKLIPPMVHVLISPGFAPVDQSPMRAIEYDSVTDRYARFLMEEVLPEVEKRYKLRQDGYSRAIGGQSSGAICAFNVAWFMPERFARVHSAIGSFTSIQWRRPDSVDGGNVYPFKVRKEAKRNIRVWLSDGANDLENDHGSWPLQNIQMANSLKLKEYDFHFRFGTASHNSSQGALDLPESLTWLWRGYDASKTSEKFEMDPAEKGKPFYRVRIDNRDAW